MEGSPPARALSAGGSRVFWMDAARALAIVSVSFNHALNRSVMLQTASLARLPYGLLASCCYVFSRFGVPLFLMLSGALLLGRDYSRDEVRKRFYRHNWGRLLLVTVLWLWIRFWFSWLLTPDRAAFGTALFSSVKAMLLLSGEDTGCMWYMAMILCVYPLIPLLSAAVSRLPGRAFLLPGCLILLVCFLTPNLNAALAALGTVRRLRSGVLAEYLPPLYLLYLVGGWYLSRGALARFSTALVVSFFLLSALGTVLFQYWMFATGTPYEIRYADLGVLAASFALFELLRRRAAAGRLTERPVRSLALHSLGVYFVHHMIIVALAIYLRRSFPALQGFAAFAVLEAAGLLGGWCFVWLTARIPFAGKYLYLIQRPKAEPQPPAAE